MNNLAQMIIMTRRCVAFSCHDDNVTSLQITVIVCTSTLFTGFNGSLLYPVHNLVLHGGVSELYD